VPVLQADKLRAGPRKLDLRFYTFANTTIGSMSVVELHLGLWLGLTAHVTGIKFSKSRELGRVLVFLFLPAKVAHRPTTSLDARFSSFSFFTRLPNLVAKTVPLASSFWHLADWVFYFFFISATRPSPER
jgi:hypothetical protein